MRGKGAVWWVIFCSFIITGIGNAAEKWLPLPPVSIAQWYKPLNDHQVWLHTMFNLRRDIQAVTEYSAKGEQTLTVKWTERFAKNYRKIAEMVPEWQDELDYQWLSRLQSAAKANDGEAVSEALRKIGQGCKSCHRDYRAVTAILYRTPDFSDIEIKKSSDGSTARYPDVMDELSTLVNRIKIATEDNHQQLALTSLQQLSQWLNDLGESCSNCHKDPEPRERFLGHLTQGALKDLEQGLRQGDKKKVGASLGSAAVYSCARCHAVHRSTFDMRDRLQP